jgi:hypothetical protein
VERYPGGTRRRAEVARAADAAEYARSADKRARYLAATGYAAGSMFLGGTVAVIASFLVRSNILLFGAGVAVMALGCVVVVYRVVTAHE